MKHTLKTIAKVIATIGAGLFFVASLCTAETFGAQVIVTASGFAGLLLCGKVLSKLGCFDEKETI